MNPLTAIKDVTFITNPVSLKGEFFSGGRKLVAAIEMI